MTYLLKSSEVLLHGFVQFSDCAHLLRNMRLKFIICFRENTLIDAVIEEVLLNHGMKPYGGLTNQDLFYCKVKIYYTQIDVSILLLLCRLFVKFPINVCNIKFSYKQMVKTIFPFKTTANVCKLI